MIRPFTLITMLLAAGSGAYLFGVKHRAQVLDDQLAAVAQQSRLDDQRIRVLQAQWALEIDPTRLQQLAAQFTALQPMKPAQLVTLASLQEFLPPPGSAGPVVNPVAPAVPDPASGAPSLSPVAQAASVLPLPPPEAPAPPLLASVAPVATPAQHSVAHLASRVASRAATHPAATELAQDVSRPRPLYAPAPVHAAYPMGAQLMSVKASSDAPGLSSGSMLGMAADLAPPQPLGTNN
jgi:hypothetical protein